ncbi:MFS transporter [Microbacterium sp. NPDC056052]|uniref:MFS transporter n=1 Tax=Microbacterium sp. NPDC056052 TaxID=3345695 RepID=UPI0035E0D0C8
MMSTSTSSTTTARAARPAAILAIVLVSYFMIVLDNSIVFTGLSRIRTELDFTTAGLSWVQTAYALVFGGLLLLAARAGDLVGRRRLFLIGLAIFSLASLSIGLAPTAEWMIASRAVQGIGSAILAPTSLALLTTTFVEGPARTRAVAAYGSTAGIGASLGLVVGGLLADIASWRVGFLMNVPIGAALLSATVVFVRETPRTGGRFDIAGAIASTLGMTALVYGITRTSDAGWADPIALAFIAAGLVVLVGFAVIEWRTPQPILPSRVLADPARGGAFLARMLFAGAIFGYFFFASQYMQQALGFSPLAAGLGFLPMTVVQFALSLTVPRLTRRYGNSSLVVVGLAITLAGMIWISFVRPDSSYWTALALPMLLLGAGQGIGFAPLTAAGVTRIEPRDAGAAAGAVNVAHQLGGALGVSIMVAVATAGITGTDPTAIAAEASTGLAAGAVLLALALAAALLLIVRWRNNETTPVPATSDTTENR